MASLMSTAIAALCASAQGQYNAACTNAFDAGTQQSGIRQSVDKAEDGTVKYVESKLDDKEKEALAVAGFVFKGAKEKKITFALPNGGVCTRITNEIATDRYSLVLKWEF